MKRLRLALAVLLTLTLWGCVGQKPQPLREEITSGDLRKFGIVGIQKIGDWYSFKREQLNIRIKISKAAVSRYRGFGNDLYFDDIEVVYPTSWTIRVIRTDGNLYVIRADTPKGSAGAAFFINLVGPIITAKDGQEWHFYRDGSKERIEVKWFRKDLYSRFHKSIS